MPQITVEFNHEQLAHMRHHFGWMGSDEYVVWFLVTSAIRERPYAGLLHQGDDVEAKQLLSVPEDDASQPERPLITPALRRAYELYTKNQK